MLPFKYSDGGRAAAGYRGRAKDCVCRAIAIATGQSYFKVYCDLSHLYEARTGRFTARNGIYTVDSKFEEYARQLGFRKVPGVGSMDDLPGGALLVQVPRHMFAVLDRVVYDTYDTQVKYPSYECYWSLT